MRSTDHRELRQELEALLYIAEDMGEVVGITGDPSPREGYEMHAIMEEVRRYLKQLEVTIDKLLVSVLPPEGIELEDGSTVKASRSAKTRWDNALVASNVAFRERTAEGAAKAILKAAQVAYWRKGVLREMGLDPDDYNTVELGPRRVKVVPR